MGTPAARAAGQSFHAARHVPVDDARVAWECLPLWRRFVALCAPAAHASGSWPMASHSILGDRAAPLDLAVNPLTVSSLKPKWVFTDHGDVSATPTVSDGDVYFPDFGGYLNAVNANNGALIWQKPISSYDGQAGQVSRNSPLILGNDLILGDNAASAQSAGAHLFAVSRATGKLIWSTQIDSNPAAIVTSSPTRDRQPDRGGCGIQRGSGRREARRIRAAASAAQWSRSMPTTGKLLWKTYMVPSNNGGGDTNIPCASPNPAAGCGYTGGAVWATPTIDPLTNQVFVGTGNNYTAPDAAVACANAAQNADPPMSDANCSASNDYFDAVVALDLTTGKIEWGHKVEGWDAWNVACLVGYPPGATWCPSPASPDFDFGGSSPNLFVVTGPNGQPKTLVGDGQKSGIYWAFDIATGNIVWDTLIGPGTSLGGLEWGSAYDGQRIYTAEADPFGIPYTTPSGQSISGGSWAALDPQTGKIDWQTATPGGNAALGPVSEAGGLLYAASMDPNPSDPDMFALDASTGKILWSFAAGSSVNAGPSIVDGTVYWGTGYAHLGPGLPYTGNNKLYAFSLNGR